MSEADPATLAAIQRVTKRCLAEIDRVCTLLDIRYVAYGGTAIGAVRHQGFIPWDDDGDVCMPRPDYERFIAEAPAVLGEEFFIASPASHSDFPISFGVLGLKGSEFISTVAKDRSFRMPIGVDLFVLDEIADSPSVFRSQLRGTWLWARLMFLRSIPCPPTGLPTPARQLAAFAMACAHWGMRALRVSEASLYRRWLKAALKGVTCPQKAADGTLLLGDFSTRDPRRWSASEAELFPARVVPFEDITLRIPAAYDVVLTRGYGDYMRVPDPSDRVTHEPYRIVFGPNDPGLDAATEGGDL